MANASNEYLRSTILTATPEQLLLMLYDGAIRFARQGVEGLQSRNWEKAFTGFSRAQKIMLELLGSLNFEVDRTLCNRMAGLYNYIYRHLVEACAERSVKSAEEALRFLEYQRETWILLMDKLRQERGGSTKATTARTPAMAAASDPSEADYESVSFEG